MISVAGINIKKAFFLEMEHHLLNDPTPSAYFRSIQNREELKTFPFAMLERLQHTKQPPLHHPEGSVWNHTLLVVDEAAKVKAGGADEQAFMWAALLHDIGKPATTRMKNGRVTSYDHDRAGAALAGEFLSAFACDDGFIRRVTALVRYHMHILYVDRDLPFADINGMREQTDPREVALLGLCDRLGRAGSDREKEEANVRLFLQKVAAQQTRTGSRILHSSPADTTMAENRLKGEPT